MGAAFHILGSSGPRCQVRHGRGLLPASGTRGPVPAPPVVGGLSAFSRIF